MKKGFKTSKTVIAAIALVALALSAFAIATFAADASGNVWTFTSESVKNDILAFLSTDTKGDTAHA